MVPAGRLVEHPVPSVQVSLCDGARWRHVQPEGHQWDSCLIFNLLAIVRLLRHKKRMLPHIHRSIAGLTDHNTLTISVVGVTLPCRL
jgi:hypothetical protein